MPGCAADVLVPTPESADRQAGAPSAGAAPSPGSAWGPRGEAQVLSTPTSR